MLAVVSVVLDAIECGGVEVGEGTMGVLAVEAFLVAVDPELE